MKRNETLRRTRNGARLPEPGRRASLLRWTLLALLAIATLAGGCAVSKRVGHPTGYLAPVAAGPGVVASGIELRVALAQHLFQQLELGLVGGLDDRERDNILLVMTDGQPNCTASGDDSATTDEILQVR